MRKTTDHLSGTMRPPTVWVQPEKLTTAYLKARKEYAKSASARPSRWVAENAFRCELCGPTKISPAPHWRVDTWRPIQESELASAILKFSLWTTWFGGLSCSDADAY